MLCCPSLSHDAQIYELWRNLMHLAPSGPRAARPGLQLAGDLHALGIDYCTACTSLVYQIVYKIVL